MNMPASYVHLADNAQSVLSAGVEGDFMEIGVWYGFTYMALAELARLNGRTCHAVDTFDGMPEQHDKDQGHYPEGKLRTLDRGKILSNQAHGRDWMQIHKGIAPDILEKDLSQSRFAFVHLDVDQYEGTLGCLRWLWPRMNPGGIIQCHDWNADRDFCASLAIKEWMAETGVPMAGENDPTIGHCWFRR